MKQFLLTGLMATAALGMAAAMPDADLQIVNAVDYVKTTPINAHYTQKAGKQVRKVKKLRKPGVESNTVRLPRHKAVTQAAENNGFAMFESFEGWDGTDPFWTPEGWTVEMRGDVDRTESWTPDTYNPSLGISVPDGNYYYGISFSSGNQDEWLISPATEISDGFVLSYWLYLNPPFLFGMDNVDWDELVFIGEKVIAATLQVWAQPEGGEWVMLHDFVDDYKDMSLMELLNATPVGLEKKSIDVSQFAGKKTKFAFRYVGTDGDTMFIDAIGVGYPELEGVSYMNPFETLYWGFDRSWQMSGLTAGIAQYPVYAPLTWTNMTYEENATYSWKYCDPETSESVTSDAPDELTVTYVPDYSSESTKRNNFFTPPTLTASAPNATPAEYTAPYLYFQAGGKYEFEFNDGSNIEGSLLPFDYNQLGLTMEIYDDPTIGDMAIPLFGHNANTNTYWLNYSLNGEEKQPGDDVQFNGIANMIFPPSAPLVVNGVTVNAYGKVADDAEFTISIYAFDETMAYDYELLTLLGTATIKGKDILKQFDDDLGYLCLPFDFETPVVIKASEDTPAYFVSLTGFNSDKVEYFAPLQSQVPNPEYICHGYMMKHIDIPGMGRDAYDSFVALVYRDADNEYHDLYSAFAIGLNAEYPWLTTDVEKIELPGDGTPVQVALGSYYDGSKLRIEAPAGVIASASGRYDECVLTLSHNNSDVVAEGNVVVKAPGVEITLPLTQSAGIGSIIADENASVTGVYDLSGRSIDAGNAQSGVYVVKYSDGSVRKVAVK